MWHQFVAIRAAKLMRYRFLLADEMGLGKTATALWCVHEAKTEKLLIICPVSVKWNWQREIYRTIGTGWWVQVIDGSKKKREALLSETLGCNDPSVSKQAIVINYDLLNTLTDQQLEQLQAFSSTPTSFCIGDEFHYIKNPGSERSKLTASLFADSPHVAGLTGTPIRNHANDLFQQLAIISPGMWLSEHDFTRRYVVTQMIQTGRQKRMIPVASKNLKELNSIVNTVQMKRLKSEVTDIPPKVHTSPLLTMDATMATVYRAMRDHARYEIEQLIASGGAKREDLIWAPRVRSGATQALMRCEQIAAGFVGGIPDGLYDRLSEAVLKGAEKIPGRPGELMFPRFAKPVWIRETIDAILAQGGAPVVFSRFNAPLFWLQPIIGDSCGILHGALKPAEKDKAIEDFQNGATKVLLCQVTMATGFNLTRSHDVVFWGRDWSPAVNVQAEDRCHRIGQKGTVNVQIPLVRGTVEEYVDKKLEAKAGAADSALAASTLGELLEHL
jgi:SWI/SNF-related matrix-associated actin-dependent regulator 1 of chromatin subfamily A